MAERDAAAAPVEQTGGGEHPDRRRRHAEGREQLAADAFGGAGEQLEAVPRLGARPGGPGEHRVADALGQRRVRLVEDLADEERVARRAPVDVGGVEPVSVEQLGDRGPAQRGELHAARARRGDEVAQHRAQRVVGADRVAVRHHQQQRQRVDPAGEEPDEVEGRLVGPVQVLDDEHAGRGTQGVQHRGEDLVLGRRVRAGLRRRRARARPRRRAAARAGGGCSAGRTCPTAPASTPARRRRAGARSCRCPPRRRAATTAPWPAAARSARVCSTSIGCSRSSSRTGEV